MQRILLKSKIHRARVTQADLDYEGSLGIDQDLMDMVDLAPGEQIHVFNINNGSRLITYAIASERGSGTILLNGAAARLGQIGDRIIVLAFANVDEKDVADFKPKKIVLDADNRAV
ncbi:MAG: aspartate 1-decarboxylase [Verrucomicrobia bacterium]|nr:aspartate 1-decarboxylase [Verrucomicrobiota bacterium]